MSGAIGCTALSYLVDLDVHGTPTSAVRQVHTVPALSWEGAGTAFRWDRPYRGPMGTPSGPHSFGRFERHGRFVCLYKPRYASLSGAPVGATGLSGQRA